MNDREHVEDILEVRVHRQIDSVSDPGRLVSWIYQITRHAIIDHYRKPGRQREIPSGRSTELEAIDEMAETSTTTHPGDVAEPREELSVCLRPMIERLPRGYRDIITLVKSMD